MSALEYVGDTKFKGGDIKPQLSPEDWLARAQEQATFARVAARQRSADLCCKSAVFNVLK